MLPALRDDLSLIEGAPTLNGEPRWLIYDPARHRYFEINAPAFELISVWQSSLESLREAAEARFRRIVTNADVEAIKSFLLANNLTVLPASGQVSEYYQQASRTHRSWFSRVLHGYLFFRIPLVRPQRMLEAWYPIVSVLMTRWFLAITLLCGLTGVYLVSRQWEAFVGSFLHFYSVEGIVLYGLSLIFIKILHELGHAFWAARYRVRVPTMGIAFMVLFPVLYSDVTDAWRLKCRKQRLAIAAGGITVELAVACFATLWWAVLPEGPAKSIAFVLATSSWVLSLVVNLNPLMRFDGYYLLMDYWGISNLQPRSFAVARWWLREVLFGLGHAPPDDFTPAQRRRLVIYAITTWIYRFFLFLGIALAVYYMFFKALGVILFVVEILFFILIPVFRELEAWWLMRQEIYNARRAWMTGGALAVLLALALIPWSGTVSVPAVLEAERRADIYSPGAARVERVHVEDGSSVNAGDVIVTLKSDDLEFRLKSALNRRDLARQRLARIASGQRERGNLNVLEQQVRAALEEIEGLRRERDKLRVRAPIDGFVADLGSELHQGRWIDRSTVIARVLSPGGARVTGLVSEDIIARLREGNDGKFVPNDIYRSQIPVRLSNIAQVGEREIRRPYFASQFGGRVAAEKEKSGTIIATKGHYQAVFSVEASPPSVVVPGIVRLAAAPESLASTAWRNVMRILVREAGV